MILSVACLPQQVAPADRRAALTCASWAKTCGVDVMAWLHCCSVSTAAMQPPTDVHAISFATQCLQLDQIQGGQVLDASLNARAAATALALLCFLSLACLLQEVALADRHAALACAGCSRDSTLKNQSLRGHPIVCLCRTGMPWLIEDPTAKDPLTQAEINYINT